MFFKKEEEALINFHTSHKKYLPQTETLNIIFKTMRFNLSKDVASSSRAWCLFELLHSFFPKSLLENTRLHFALRWLDLLGRTHTSASQKWEPNGIFGSVFWMIEYLFPPHRQQTWHCPVWRRRQNLEQYNLTKTELKVYWYRFFTGINS